MGRDGGFDEYAKNVKTLPHDSTSVIIRSFFGRFGTTHPLYVAGRGSVEHVDDRADELILARVCRGRAIELLGAGLRPLHQAVNAGAHRAELRGTHSRARRLVHDRGRRVAGRPVANSSRGDDARDGDPGRRADRHRPDGWTTDELTAASTDEPADGNIRSRDAPDWREQPVSRPAGRGVPRAVSRAAGPRVAFAGARANGVVVVSIPDWGVTPFATQIRAQPGHDRERDRGLQRGRA